MSGIIYKLKWTLYIEGMLIHNKTNEFTSQNYNRFLDFLSLYCDCIHYHIETDGMRFDCDDAESAETLINRINDLSNEKDAAISSNNLYNTFEVKDIKVNGPATIIFWGDGTKTVVKCFPTETYDVEKAVAMCFMKKALGCRSMTKIFDLAEDKVAEYRCTSQRLKFTDVDTYSHNALSTFLNPNPGKLSDLKAVEPKGLPNVVTFKPGEVKE